MIVYFSFEISRLHEKDLEEEMERHMQAAHMKKDIRDAKTFLSKARAYDRKRGIPHGDYEQIEIRSNGIYLTDHDKEFRIDLLKK